MSVKGLSRVPNPAASNRDFMSFTKLFI